MTPRRALFTAVLAACILTTACSRPDTTPLPTTASPPFVCDHVPLQAVERMTGLRNPPAKGSFELAPADGDREGWCGVYRPDEEEVKVLDIELATNNDPGRVESEVRDGAKRLLRILADADGYYSATRFGDHAGALAVLIRGKSMLVVDMDRGAEGRDHEADVVALMRLIAPRLLGDAVPSPTPGKGS